MKIVWYFFVAMCCMTLVAGFDLGPIIRIGQCRSECLRKHNTNGSCDSFSNHNDTVCTECWKNCEALENKEDTRAICEGDQYLRCPACQTACTYHNTRVAEKYEPSMLPAPNKGPILLGRYDVAIVMQRIRQEWKVSGYYCGNQALNVEPYTWIIVVTGDGLRHYSWQEWVPTLDSLQEGPLFEATISWRDMRLQLQRQQEKEQKKFNDRVRQFFLEKYGEKVLTEWNNEKVSRIGISREVFRRLFFKKQDDDNEMTKSLDTTGRPYTSNEDIFSKKQSFVVSWGPEAGGLTGNQVTDGDSAQISLLPGTKYLVRVASNDGPGSFPIIVDTRPAVKFACPSSNYYRISEYLWLAFFVNIILLLLLLSRCNIFYRDTNLLKAEVEKV